MISVDISVDASVDMSVTTRSSIDRVSVDTWPRYWPTVGRVSFEYRPCVDLQGFEKTLTPRQGPKLTFLCRRQVATESFFQSPNGKIWSPKSGL